MTHPQQTTREVLEQALSAMEFASQYLETDNAAMLHIPAAIKACEAALAHHTPSTTGEALVKLIPTAEELGAPQVEQAPSTKRNARRLTKDRGCLMADISKEMDLQLALSAGFMKFLKPENRPEMICGPDEIARLIKLARNQALEEAKQACVATHSKRSKEGLKTGYNAIMQCSDAIESLKDNTP